MRARVVLLSWLAFACGPEYPSGRVLERPRILAVRLEPPEATLGDRVAAEVLVASPESDTETLEVSLWQCPPTRYVPHGCAGESDAIRVGDVTGEMEVGEDWRYRVERAGPFHVHLVVTAFLETENDSETAIKRLVLGPEESDEHPNENPVLEALLVGDEEEEGEEGGEGEEVAVAPGASVRLTPIVGEGSVEPYLLRTIDGEEVHTEEEMYVSYYASCGTLGAGLLRGEYLASSWRAPSEGACTVWAVLRDGRGGTDWRARRIAAVPE